MEKDFSARTPRVSPQSGLLPCPFCSGAAEIEATGYNAEVAHQTFERIDVWVCGCVECGIRGPSSTASEDDAIAEWNKRNAHDDLVAALILARRKLAESLGLTVESCTGGPFVQINAALAKAGREPEPRGEADPSSHP